MRKKKSKIGFTFIPNENFDKSVEEILQTLEFEKISHNFYVSKQEHDNPTPLNSIIKTIVNQGFTTNFSLFFLGDIDFEKIVEAFRE